MAVIKVRPVLGSPIFGGFGGLSAFHGSLKWLSSFPKLLCAEGLHGIQGFGCFGIAPNRRFQKSRTCFLQKVYTKWTFPVNAPVWLL